MPTPSLHYIELVTPDPEAARDVYAASQGWTFTGPTPELGGAYVTTLDDGTIWAIRAPMNSGEQPVVRPYLRVGDVEAAASQAESCGGTVALPPTEIAGRGRIAIVFVGSVQQGFWEPAAPA